MMTKTMLSSLKSALASVLLAGCLAGVMHAAQAAGPATLNYQGFLTDQKSGVPVNASVSVVFAIYDSTSGGPALYTETQTLAVSNGVINAQIGSVTPFPATLAFDKPYWLEVTVGSDTLAPRQAVASSAYAQTASGITSFGSSNTRAGDSALQSNTIGFGNTAYGVGALQSNTSGMLNSASGAGALSSNTTGRWNTAFGQYALQLNTTGGSNTASGQGALLSNSTGSYNTASGQGALSSNTTGNLNTASGHTALLLNTTGSNNTATGQGALSYNTTGGSNTASGQAALQLNTTGSNNSATGQYALYANTTGASNTAVGQAALQLNTTGSNNSATGQNALYANTTGASNTAVGQAALQLNTTGSYNSATGQSALNSNTTGFENTASGQGALSSNTTGNLNTASGQAALHSNTTGGLNTASGQGALQSNTTGSNNTATGQGALFMNTTGSNNSATGQTALYSNSTGSHNIGIGFAGGSSIVDGSYNVSIGSAGAASDNGIIRIGDATNSKGAFVHGIQGVVPAKDDGKPVVVSSEGQLATVPNITLTSAGLGFGATTRQMLNLWNTGYGIGVQANMLYLRTVSGFGWFQGGVHSDAWNDPGAGGKRLMGLSEQGLRVVGSDPAGANDISLLADGSIHAKVVNTTSDRNAKENFADIDSRAVLAKVVALPLQTWNYRSDEHKVKHVGPVAQDFHAAFNVGADDTHIATVDADGVALAAIQGLYRVVEEKDAAIGALGERLAAQEETITRLNADRDGLQARIESVEQETRAQLAQLRRALGTMQQQGAQPVPAVLSH
jgi:hypothetical protein